MTDVSAETGPAAFGAPATGRLRGQRVLVTGASGFIGSRLVEWLLMDCGAHPRILLRDYSRAARAARLGLDRVEVATGSLSDAESLDAAVAGCSVVFHCAYDPASARSNLGGVQALIEACLKHGARLVHVSTFSVYEPLPAGDLTEDMPPVRSGIAYSEDKLDVEEAVLSAVEQRGLDAVVLMPTIVYGPGSKPWTAGPAGQLASGTVLLPDGGAGLCNAVHVDDVCQALILAAVTPEAKGRRYFVSGEEPVTWKEFYATIAEVIDRPGPQTMPRKELEKKNANVFSAIKLLAGDPKRLLRWNLTRKLAFWAKDNMPPAVKEQLKQVYKIYRRSAPAPVYTPDPSKMELYTAQCRVRIDRAKADLGYAPRYDFATGMGETSTGGWLKWAMPAD